MCVCVCVHECMCRVHIMHGCVCVCVCVYGVWGAIVWVYLAVSAVSLLRVGPLEFSIVSRAIRVLLRT